MSGLCSGLYMSFKIMFDLNPSIICNNYGNLIWSVLMHFSLSYLIKITIVYILGYI